MAPFGLNKVTQTLSCKKDSSDRKALTTYNALDEEIGIVGYEIPFNRHFYVYQPPRDLAEIDADLDKVSAEIMQLLREVHS